MNRALITLIVVFLLACNSATDKQPEAETDNNASEPSAPVSLEPFADSLVRLDKYSPASIEKCGYYFEKLVPTDSLLADSASVLFLNMALTAVDSINQKMWKDTADYSSLVYEGGPPPSAALQSFKQSLQQSHVNLQGNGEGDAVAVLDYQWFSKVVQPKTSASVDAFLDLLGAEEASPALLDAGIAISLEELINRLLESEALLTQKLPSKYSQDVAGMNKFYTNTLLLGTDNSPAFEDELKMLLTPEFKTAYDRLLTTHPSSAAAKTVTDWLAIIKTKDQKKFQQMKEAQWQ